MANIAGGVCFAASIAFIGIAWSTGLFESDPASTVEPGITHPDWTQSLYQTYDWKDAAAVERKIYDRIQTGDCYRPVAEPANLTTVIRNHHTEVTRLESPDGTPIFVHTEEIAEEHIPAKAASFMLVYTGAVQTACVDQLQILIPTG